MTEPAAAAPEPIAVLVLAWDEATPAVRALVEATHSRTPTVDSILVMVPQADAPDQLSPEEYLPLALPTAAAPAPLAPSPAPHIAPPPTAAEPATMPEAAAEEIVATPEPPAPVTEGVNAASPSQRAAAPVNAALVWAAVRVLRLGSLSLPQLAARAGQPLPAPTWLGPATLPATPYLGASSSESVDTEPGARPSEMALAEPATTNPLQPTSAPASSLPAPTTPLPAAISDWAGVQGPATLADASRYEAAESLAQATDLEADLLPDKADEATDFEADSEIFTPIDPAFRAAEFSPQHADWPQALAALGQPASLPKPATAALAPAKKPPTHPALRPVATHYPAPDLNFQIIQYARFAVPVVLAEPLFAAIYAPAWPTWLAAQELRLRLRRPLVLHVATLAAADNESVETATGWIAELQRQALRRADLILTETPALAQRLRHELGLAFGSVQVVAAADAAGIAQALHEARPRPAG